MLNRLTTAISRFLTQATTTESDLLKDSCLPKIAKEDFQDWISSLSDHDLDRERANLCNRFKTVSRSCVGSLGFGHPVFIQGVLLVDDFKAIGMKLRLIEDEVMRRERLRASNEAT